MELVGRRDPILLDFCALAADQSEQIPIFGEALQRCASDVLAGTLSAILPLGDGKPGFSFSAFSSPDDGDYVLALCGPPARLRTIAARMRRARLLRKVKKMIRKEGKR